MILKFTFLSRLVITKPNVLVVKSHKKIGGRKRISLMFLSSDDLADAAEFDVPGVNVQLRGGVLSSERRQYRCFLVGVSVSELPFINRLT